jgi:hypothetical protein
VIKVHAWLQNGKNALKRRSAYPELDHLLHAYFNEDFDLWGHTIEEIVGCYKRESPAEGQHALCDEITRFMRAHRADLDAAFLKAYPNEVDPSGWGHTTASFLAELDRLLREPGPPPAAP